LKKKYIPAEDHPARFIFTTTPPPRPGVKADLVYHEGSEGVPEWWTLRMYEDNFRKFSGEDRLVIFNWASDIIKRIRDCNVAIWPEKFENVPEGVWNGR
jgi:hypothetical protein